MKKKLDTIYNECMAEIYWNSEPKADWYVLLSKAKLNKEGKKVIPYKKYKIEESKMQAIVDKYLKKYKLTRREQTAFTFNVYLGPSPIYK